MRPPSKWSGRRMMITLPGVVATILVGSVLLAGCGSAAIGSSATPTSTAAPATAGVIPASSTEMASLPPATSNPISELVGDPRRAGVWFWDLTSTGDVIYNVSGTGKLSAYPIFTGSSTIFEQGTSGLAVSSAGEVWFGINTTLVELNPSTGNIQTWAIPAGRGNPRDQPTSTSDMAGHRAVNAIAVGPQGQVAIAMNSESSAELFNSATSEFTTLLLPTITDKALSVTYAGDGSLCVGLSDLATGGHANQLLLVDSSGAISTATVSGGTAWEVAPYATSTFVVGSFDPHLVTSSGVVTAIEAPAALTGTAAAPTPLRPLPNGRLLGIADNGLIEFPINATTPSSATAEATMLTLPPIDCGGTAPNFGGPPDVGATPEPTPTPLPPGTLCPQHFGDINAVDGAGNIWFVESHAQAGVALVAPKG